MSRDAGSHLADLRSRLLALHKVLLEDQRRAYEEARGPVASSGELLRLVLHDDAFAWLRPLSGVIAGIDAALDELDEVAAPPSVEALVHQVLGLLRSGGSGPFETRYRDVLQRSPDAIMAHAAVIKLL